MGNIQRVLGHGIRIDNWSRDNGARALVGLNNLEASAIIDGTFTGSISISFDITADVSFLKAIMGDEILESSTTRRYVPRKVPPTLSFALFLNNEKSDTVETLRGDAFFITGVVISSAQFSIDEGNAVHVSLDCAYKTEKKIENVDIPNVESPEGQPFNYGMVNAYFWNPDSNVNDPSDFDSIECTIQRLSFSINHPAQLLKGIGRRVAKDRFFQNITYNVSMSAVFKDSKKFLERFYGCKTGPANYVAPFEKVSIIIENFFRDARHAKLVFDFHTVKINNDSMPIAIENAIMEDLTLIPLKSSIKVYNGAPPEPSISVSPRTLERGQNIYINVTNLAPGEPVLVSSELFGGDIEVTANCLGEATLIFPTDASTTLGPKTILIKSSPSLPLSGVEKSVVVFEVGGIQPTLACSVKLFEPGVETIARISGANFTGTAVTLSVEKMSNGEWSEAVGAVLPTPDSLINGAFTTPDLGKIKLPSTGRYRLVATDIAGHSAYYELYVPEIVNAVLSSDKKTIEFSARYLPTQANVGFKIVEMDRDDIGLGKHRVAFSGYLPGPTEVDVISYSRVTGFPSEEGAEVVATISNINAEDFIFKKELVISS